MSLFPQSCRWRRFRADTGAHPVAANRSAATPAEEAQALKDAAQQAKKDAEKAKADAEQATTPAEATVATDEAVAIAKPKLDQGGGTAPNPSNPMVEQPQQPAQQPAPGRRAQVPVKPKGGVQTGGGGTAQS